MDFAQFLLSLPLSLCLSGICFIHFISLFLTPTFSHFIYLLRFLFSVVHSLCACFGWVSLLHFVRYSFIHFVLLEQKWKCNNNSNTQTMRKKGQRNESEPAICSSWEFFRPIGMLLNWVKSTEKRTKPVLKPCFGSIRFEGTLQIYRYNYNDYLSAKISYIDDGELWCYEYLIY